MSARPRGEKGSRDMTKWSTLNLVQHHKDIVMALNHMYDSILMDNTRAPKKETQVY